MSDWAQYRVFRVWIAFRSIRESVRRPRGSVLTSYRGKHLKPDRASRYIRGAKGDSGSLMNFDVLEK